MEITVVSLFIAGEVCKWYTIYFYLFIPELIFMRYGVRSSSTMTVVLAASRGGGEYPNEETIFIDNKR